MSYEGAIIVSTSMFKHCSAVNEVLLNKFVSCDCQKIICYANNE